MRHRHALYLSEAMTQQLHAAVEAHRVSKSAILELALQQYLTSLGNGQPNDTQSLQHQATGRSLRRLERDLAITTELTATFVRYFVTITPPIASSEHTAARARTTPVRTGDRGSCSAPSDGSKLDGPRDVQTGNRPVTDAIRQLWTG